MRREPPGIGVGREEHALGVVELVTEPEWTGDVQWAYRLGGAVSGGSPARVGHGRVPCSLMLTTPTLDADQGPRLALSDVPSSVRRTIAGFRLL